MKAFTLTMLILVFIEFFTLGTIRVIWRLDRSAHDASGDFCVAIDPSPLSAFNPYEKYWKPRPYDGGGCYCADEDAPKGTWAVGMIENCPLVNIK